MIVVHGQGVCQGISVGKLIFLDERQETVMRIPEADPDMQWARFLKAQKETAAQLAALSERARTEAGGQAAMIFQAHQMIANDTAFADTVEKVIREERVNAEFAVRQAAESFAAVLQAMDDAYMKERAADITEVSAKIIRAMGGASGKIPELKEPCIIAAANLAPDALLQTDKAKLLGLILRKGSANSHTTILARTMGIPAVVRAEHASFEEWNGHPAILDGKEGLLYVDPDEETLHRLMDKQKDALAKRCLLQSLKGKENVTKSGRKIDVFANISGPEETETVLENDAGGIGLFRSEFLYLGRGTFPGEEEQFLAYRQVLERMSGRKVIIRTLDIGADKKADYFGLEAEENPALGFRAIRICLDRTDIFRTQLRALYRASVYGNLSVLFPMIVSEEEVIRIRKAVCQVQEELKREGSAFRGDVELGIMIETPAAALISARLAKLVDFFSVGTNDLTQYTLAADRQNARLASLYDPHHPAVLELIRMAARNARQEGKRIGICGDLAADLSMTETFLKMGIDELSVPPQAVLPLREKIRACE